jgi:hypothetical protein
MSAQPERTTGSVRSTIIAQFHQVALEHGRTLAPLTDELKLFDSGLDSLGLATIVARLADLLNSDPFNSGLDVSPVNFGDFVRMYEICDASGSDDLAVGGRLDTALIE